MNGQGLAERTVAIAQDLIRIDTTNTGDDSGPGERVGAEYVLGLLQDAGYEPQLIEAAPRRASVILRIEGQDPTRDALVLHGHLDVVPAQAADWSVPPFAGLIKDGQLWGRGAVDMKDMDAMMLAIVADWARRGVKPPRDIVLCFFADEEAGGWLGSHYLVEHHPQLFAGATQAVGEVGGFSTTVAGRRAYLIQTAEKGIAWLRLLARGTAGHGSAHNQDNAIVHLIEALRRIDAQEWPFRLTPTMTQLVRGIAELTGTDVDLGDPAAVSQLIDALGGAARFVRPCVATSCNLTGLAAGYKVNVVPAQAEATVDIRPLPGEAAAVRETVERLAGPEVEVSYINDDVAVEAPFDVPLVDQMAAALGRADPGAAVWPYLLSAGTDAKALSTLGIDCYGFVPLRLPADFDFTAMFHGVDERVPVESVGFGVRVLADFLANC
jgi:acetylornithine deacetylase/succinyl-diaminopimelate desuccinylase-like protein